LFSPAGAPAVVSAGRLAWFGDLVGRLDRYLRTLLASPQAKSSPVPASAARGRQVRSRIGGGRRSRRLTLRARPACVGNGLSRRDSPADHQPGDPPEIRYDQSLGGNKVFIRSFHTATGVASFNDTGALTIGTDVILTF